MTEQLKPEWTNEIYKDFPEFKSTIDSLILTTDHFNELAKDYYDCKSTIQQLSKEQSYRKINEFRTTLNELKSEIEELLESTKK